MSYLHIKNMFSQRLLNHECVVLRSAAHNMSAQGILHQTTYISNSEKGAGDPSLTFCKNLGHLLLMRGPIDPKQRDAPTRRASRLAMADDVAELCAPPAAAKIAAHLCLRAHTAS